MNRISTIALLTLLTLGGALAGCASRGTDNVSPGAELSYVQFRGDAGGASFTVKQGGRTIMPFREVWTSERYTIRAGRYDIAVHRGGRIVSNRTYYLAPGATTDIWVE